MRFLGSSSKRYVVHVPAHKSQEQVWLKLKMAREHKKSLAIRGLQGHIIVQEFVDGWNLPEREIK